MVMRYLLWQVGSARQHAGQNDFGLGWDQANMCVDG